MGDGNDCSVIWTSGQTFIYWDMKHYPVHDAHLRKIYFHIQSVLEEEYLFFGSLQTMGYGIEQRDHHDFRDILFRHHSKDADIIVDILNETRKSPDDVLHRFDRHDIVLVTKQEQVDWELLRIVKCLASRDHRVWLLAPPEQGNLLDSYEAVHRNMCLIKGKTRPQSSASSA